MTTEPTPLVTVLPCDLDLYRALLTLPEDNRARRLSGEPVVHATDLIARHRLAALEAAAEVAENDAAEVYPTSVSNRRHLEVCVSIATAIRALSNKTGEEHLLARMVAMDEEIEAQHPGWMTGAADEPQDERAWVAAELSQALVNRNEDRFRTIAFWKRHVIIAALEAAASNKGGRDEA